MELGRLEREVKIDQTPRFKAKQEVLIKEAEKIDVSIIKIWLNNRRLRTLRETLNIATGIDHGISRLGLRLS
jgi:hypothetical protein